METVSYGHVYGRTKTCYENTPDVGLLSMQEEFIDEDEDILEPVDVTYHGVPYDRFVYSAPSSWYNDPIMKHFKRKCDGMKLNLRQGIFLKNI